MYPVREMSTGTPAILPLVLRKYLRFGMSASATLFSNLADAGPCSASAAVLLGDILDLNIHVHAALPEPAQAGIGRRPAIFVFFEPRNRAIVNHLAIFITPAGINHLANRYFIDVARDHAIDEPGRILARDQIFIKRRDINQRAGITDRVVLVLVVHLIHAHRVVARPLAIIQAVAECKRSLVKRGSDGQDGLAARVPR